MARASQESPTRRIEDTDTYRGGLARSLVRTLLIFTFLPLILLGGAAYLRTRALLRDQVVGHMRSQIVDQVGQVDLSVKTKEIRLDRLARSPEDPSVRYRG